MKKNAKNSSEVEMMIREIYSGIDRINIFPLDEGKIKIFIRTDGLYDTSGILRFRFDEEYTERCLTSAVKNLKQIVSIYTARCFVKFPSRKNCPMLIEH